MEYCVTAEQANLELQRIIEKLKTQYKTKLEQKKSAHEELFVHTKELMDVYDRVSKENVRLW